MLQETVACFEVRCFALQQLHEALCSVHSCVQAAAAARVAGGPDIVDSAENGDGVSVLCHVIAGADSVMRTKALHVSAREGHLEVCRLLLQCNADVKAKWDFQ